MNRDLARLLRCQAHYDQVAAARRDQRAAEQRDLRRTLAVIAMRVSTTTGLWWWPPSWFEPAPHPRPTITTPRVPRGTPS